MGYRRSRLPSWLKRWRMRPRLLKLKPKRTCLDCGFLAYGDQEADGPDRERFHVLGQLGGYPGEPELWRCFRGQWTAHLHYGGPSWEPVLTEVSWDQRGCRAFRRHSPGRTPAEHLKLEDGAIEFRRKLMLGLLPVLYGSLGAAIGWFLAN